MSSSRHNRRYSITPLWSMLTAPFLMLMSPAAEHVFFIFLRSSCSFTIVLGFSPHSFWLNTGAFLLILIIVWLEHVSLITPGDLKLLEEERTVLSGDTFLLESQPSLESDYYPSQICLPDYCLVLPSSLGSSLLLYSKWVGLKSLKADSSSLGLSWLYGCKAFNSCLSLLAYGSRGSLYLWPYSFLLI